MMNLRNATFAVILFFVSLSQWSIGQNNPYKAPFYWSVYEYHITREQQGVADNYITEAALMANVDWVDKNLRSMGCDMICMDGWGDISKLNINGYRTTHSRHWTHDYAWWSATLQGRGMKLGMYANPLWVHVGSDNKTTRIAGTNILVSSLLDPTENAKFPWVQVDHPGAEQYVKGYIKYYADMGIKYLRVDFLSWFENGQDRYMGRVGPNRPREYYLTALRWMREAADENGVFLSLVMPHLFNEAEAESQYGHMFRINEDTGEGKWWKWSDNVRGIKRTGWSVYANPVDGLTYWSVLSGRNKVILDPDFIRINTFANTEEKKSVVSLCLVSGGALTVSDQYNTIGKDLWLYQNKEILALNADGFVGKPLTNDPANALSQVWTGQLTNGDWIVGLFNRENMTRTRSINFSTLGIEGNASIRDLWEHANLASAGSFSASIPAHGCRIIKVAASGNILTGMEAMHVKSLATGAQSAGTNLSNGTATVTITDKDGNAIEGAVVTVTFSATFNENVSGVTGSDGSVTLTSSTSAPDPIKVIAAVTSLTHQEYVYSADKNLGTVVGNLLYLGGAFNDWKLKPMHFENGWWSSDSLLLQAGDQQIKFADTPNWTGDDWGNAIGLEGTASKSTGGLPNISFNILNTALYDISFNEFTLGYKIENNPHIQLNKTMYVAGTFNNWVRLPMSLTVSGWKVEKVPVKAGSFELKFANTSNWSGNDWGDASGLTGTARLTTGGKPNVLFTIANAGNYTFTFNDITLAYSITSEITNGADQQPGGVISIYPNPTNGWVTISMGIESNASLEIFNLQGMLIHQQKLAASDNRIDLKSLHTSGLVWMRIVADKRTFVTSVQLNK